MPAEPYGQTKLAEELVLRSISKENENEVVIIRPPLVYGPGVKGNLRSLLILVDKGLPFPHSALNKNKRNYVTLSNLIDLLIRCVEH